MDNLIMSLLMTMLEHITIPTLQPIIHLATRRKRRALSATLKSREPHDAKHLLQYGSIDIFRHYVGRVIGSEDLEQLNSSITNLLLAPKISDIQVSDLA